LHLLLDHDGYLPVYAHLTEGRVHEMIVAKSLNFSGPSLFRVGNFFLGQLDVAP
jgi:hypothetical protein